MANHVKVYQARTAWRRNWKSEELRGWAAECFHVLPGQCQKEKIIIVWLCPGDCQVLLRPRRGQATCLVICAFLPEESFPSKGRYQALNTHSQDFSSLFHCIPESNRVSQRVTATRFFFAVSVRFPTLKYGNPFDLDTRKQLRCFWILSIFRNIRNHQKSPWPFWQTSSFYCLVDHGFGPILLSHPDDTGWVQGEEGTDHSHCVLLQKHSHIHKRNKETKTWSLKHWQRETPQQYCCPTALANLRRSWQIWNALSKRWDQQLRQHLAKCVRLHRNMGPCRSREDNFI